MASRRDAAERRTAMALETAARELSLTADELRRIADSVRSRSRATALHLEGTAVRLDALAGMLGQEVMLGVDPSLVRSLGASAKRLLGIGVAGATFFAGGMIEGAGAEFFGSIRNETAPVAQALAELDRAAQQLITETAQSESENEDVPEKAGALPVGEPPVIVAPETQGFSGREAAAVIGITDRQLDYWARTDLIRPSLAEPAGGGSRRRYSYSDLVELKMIKTLINAGQRLDRVRKAFDYLRDIGDDLTAVKLVIAGDSVVLVRDGGELLDVVNKYQGQGVVSVLVIDRLVDEVDSAIRGLRPAPS